MSGYDVNYDYIAILFIHIINFLVTVYKTYVLMKEYKRINVALICAKNVALRFSCDGTDRYVAMHRALTDIHNRFLTVVTPSITSTEGDRRSNCSSYDNVDSSVRNAYTVVTDVIKNVIDRRHDGICTLPDNVYVMLVDIQTELSKWCNR